MKNTVKLLPPTDLAGNFHYVYGNGRYTFSDPTPQRKYVKILALVRAYNAKGMVPTRALIKKNLGMPLDRGWGSATWAALYKAGLLDHTRAGRTTVYYMTPRGCDFLKQMGV